MLSLLIVETGSEMYRNKAKAPLAREARRPRLPSPQRSWTVTSRWVCPERKRAWGAPSLRRRRARWHATWRARRFPGPRRMRRWQGRGRRASGCLWRRYQRRSKGRRCGRRWVCRLVNVCGIKQVQRFHPKVQTDGLTNSRVLYKRCFKF